MPYRCCVINCSGNYDKGRKVSVFKFPKEQNFRKIWLHRIKREDFKLTSSSRVCELHFKDADIQRTTEYFDEKTGSLLKVPLLYPRLKKDAVPCIIPGCSSNIQPCDSTVKPRNSPESKKRILESRNLEQAIAASQASKKNYDSRRTFNSLMELKLCLNLNKISESFDTIERKDKIFFIKISEDNPEIKGFIVVDSNLQLTVYFRNQIIKKMGKFNFESMVVNNFNTLCEILNGLESLCGTEPQNDIVIELIIQLLEKLECVKTYECHLNLIKFIIEQLQRLNSKQHNVRYSTDCMVFCCLLNAISPHCYKFLRNSKNLILPHPVTLQRICSNLSCNPKLEQSNSTFLSYIQRKSFALTDLDKIVILMVDEIHLQSHFDYIGGKMTGMAYNTTDAASSAYVFMIRSLRSSYKDVVHILPVKTLTAEDLHMFIMKTIIGLENLMFKVIAVVTDNNSINRKSMSHFSTPPKFDIIYKHPSDSQRPLFFVIDTVHLLKSIRNNWLNQKNSENCMYYPDFNSLLPFKTARFSALKELHDSEVNCLLKYGYGLTFKALCPSTMERQNVKLALQIFSPSVIEGLLVVGKEKSLSNFEETSEYIDIIWKWWSIMNVKTVFKGIHKLDEYQEPLQNDLGLDLKFIFLDQFIKWLDSWKAMNCSTGSLTNETHQALKNSTQAIVEMARYCFKDLNFQYFLPGKIQTDALEDRFGRYRQLSGAQYCISIRQVFENENKLRLESLLPLKLNSSKFGAQELSVFNDKHDWEGMELSKNNLKSQIQITPEEISECDPVMPLITYIAGYSAHVVLKRLKCEICKNCIVSHEKLDFNCQEWIKKFDRGGLKYPHSDVVCVVLYSYLVIGKLLTKFEEEFLCVDNQRCLATTIILDIISEEDVFLGLDTCQKGHTLQCVLKHIIWVCVNVLLNNYCKKENDNISIQKLQKQKRIKNANVSPRKRKLKTLQN